eukprot:15362490-Alexandrium_andersonii.AAC.1
MREYDSTPPEDARASHHRMAVKFLGVDGPAWAQLETFLPLVLPSPKCTQRSRRCSLRLRLSGRLSERASGR